MLGNTAKNILIQRILCRGIVEDLELIGPVFNIVGVPDFLHEEERMNGVGFRIVAVPNPEVFMSLRQESGRNPHTIEFCQGSSVRENNSRDVLSAVEIE